MKNNRYTLRALSQLLSYPDAAQRAQLPQLMPVLKYDDDAAEKAYDRTMRFFGRHLA